MAMTIATSPSRAGLTDTTPQWLLELGNPTGHGVRVGMIDSGIDAHWHHPRVLPGINLTDTDRMDVGDHIGHGTSCSDIVLGMAPDARVVPIRVFGERLETSVGTIAKAVRWAIEQRLEVINLSLGSDLDRSLEPLYVACEAARRRGIVVVSAVRERTGFSYPAVFDNALGVEVDDFDNVYDFRYRAHAAVECHAQGNRVVRALGGGVHIVRGSSFAAPHITAIVARLRQAFPDTDLDLMRRLLDRYSVDSRRLHMTPGEEPT